MTRVTGKEGCLAFLLDVDARVQEGLGEDYRSQVSSAALQVWDVVHRHGRLAGDSTRSQGSLITLTRLKNTNPLFHVQHTAQHTAPRSDSTDAVPF